MPEQLSKPSLDVVNALVEEVTLPTDFMVVLMSGRPETIGMIRRPNGLNAKETAQVIHAFGVLVQTNLALQEHVKGLVQKVEQLHDNAKGLLSKIDQIRDAANFRDPIDTTDEY